MKRPRKAVRVGVPILVIGVLALAALWRVGAPPPATTGATAASQPPRRGPLEPLTRIGDIAVETVLPRQALLEDVRLAAVPSERTAWIESGDAKTASASERAFVVLDPDVKRPPDLRWEAGAHVTLIGLVRPAPPPDSAIGQWNIDAATAAQLQQRGTYLHVTEMRAVTAER
jgi:hypothetical protein